MFEFYNKHYINVDAAGRITGGWSDGPHNAREVTEEDILLNDQGGYQFRLILDGEPTEENPPLYTMDGIPLYKWDGEQVVERTEEEIEEDRAEIEAKRKEEEQARIENATETVLLEMAAEHEERICLLELGMTEV